MDPITGIIIFCLTLAALMLGLYVSQEPGE